MFMTPEVQEVSTPGSARWVLPRSREEVCVVVRSSGVEGSLLGWGKSGTEGGSGMDGMGPVSLCQTDMEALNPVLAN